jgi:hypothetical protein
MENKSKTIEKWVLNISKKLEKYQVWTDLKKSRSITTKWKSIEHLKVVDQSTLRLID